MAAIKGRGVVMAMALILAIGAAAAVFLYLRAVEDDAGGGELTTVIVSKRDIAAGTRLDPLIAEGEFTTREIPRDALVAGVVTDVTQLQGKVTAFPILSGEQISSARFKGPTEAAGGTLGIPEGFQAISFQFQRFQGVGGILTQGDHVAVYGSFKQPGSSAGVEVPGVTMTIVKEALVLRSVGGPSTTSGVTSGTGTVVTASTPMIVTLALTPAQAQKLIFAQDQGTVWLSLLPPGEEGSVPQPTTFGRLLQ